MDSASVAPVPPLFAAPVAACPGAFASVAATPVASAPVSAAASVMVSMQPFHFWYCLMQ
jgi:hypothetical protein